MSEENKPAEEAENGPSVQNVLILNPDESRRQILEEVVLELLPGVTIEGVEDTDEAEVALEENDVDMVILDLLQAGISESEFVKTVNNDESIALISLNVDAIDMKDDKSGYKLDPLKKLFLE